MYFVVVCTTPQKSNIKSIFFFDEHHLSPLEGGRSRPGRLGEPADVVTAGKPCYTQVGEKRQSAAAKGFGGGFR